MPGWLFNRDQRDFVRTNSSGECYPAAALCRLGHRLDGLGRIECILNICSLRLARCYRLDEAIGLHDLEVVVTHRDARRGLEPSEITVAGCHVVSKEGGVLVVLVQAQL